MNETKVIPIYSISEFCNTLQIDNIKVVSFSNEACTAAEFDANHRHEYYEIGWLKRGKGIHTIDAVDYPYAGSVLFLLSPGQMHKIKPIERGEGYVIKFLPALFKDSRDMDEYLQNTGLFDNIETQPVIPVTSSLHVTLDDVLSKMDAEFNVNEEDKENILLSYLKILITHISRLKKVLTPQAIPHMDSNLKLFRDYKIAIERNFKKQHGVQYYAELLATQPRTINTASRKCIGKTAGELIDNRILLEAKRELYYGDKSIKEIAFELGFDDPAYFTRFFKKLTGVSPIEYKMRLGEKDSSLASA